ncbi:phosphopantetheine-binding protein [Amycolatopsis sp. CA-230715]|uniref:acyl carrier protein n=1 Tax=Amycolatopsis sp. CA-230715 TaxID=2745196 RepID=UPI003FA4D2ED
MRLDLTALRAELGGSVPPLLRGLLGDGTARPAAGKAAAQPDLSAELAGLSEAERRRAVLRLVRTQVATVLGHDDQSAVEVNRGFLEMGFDSLTAVDLRNRLTALTGRPLPATLLFDYPSPGELAEHLTAELGQVDGGDGGSLHADLERLERSVSAAAVDDGQRGEIATRLRALLAQLTPGSEEVSVADQLDAATDDEIFEFIDNNLDA